MKRFIAVLSGILVLPAFAEVAPVYYDEIVEYTDDMLNDEEIVEEAVVQPKAVAQRNTINRSTSTSRAISTSNKSGARTNTTTRAVASSPRSATGTARGTASRTARTSNVVNRPSTTTTSRASVKSRGTQNTKPVSARVSVGNNSVMAGSYIGTGTNTTKLTVLENTSDTLYNPNTSRVGMQSARGKTVRLSSALSTSTTPVVTEEDISSTTSNLTAVAELTDYCKAQYAACMDNYCNVLDDNQGRCSCSKNLKNYEKVENALATATEQFQEVVQKIRYIGLTGPQIESLFAETEAELAMKSGSDSSQLKSSLDAIKRKVVEVSSPTATSSSVTSGLSLDLNGLLTADFTSGFDLNSFLGTNNTSTSSVSNQRGEQLFKTATNRCKEAVLNSCVAQGIDANMITNSYDLEIDKQCIAYERALTDANTEMKNNVFNATNILQQARLLLTQNKNSYDLRGCVAAIDECMQDEYVCGSDYELCLDPTGKYIANGEIIKGGTPGVSGGQNKATDALSESNLSTWTSGGMYDLYATWNYTASDEKKNAWGRGTTETLGEYVDTALDSWKSTYTKNAINTDSVAMYLLQKIGYVDSDDKVHGMCASAMKQCQDYTFETSKNKTKKTYIPDNEVVRQYLNSTLAKIKVQQDALLADYAEGCSTDVQSCLTTNGYDGSNTASSASKTAVSACASEIATCMSVNGYTPKDGINLTLRAMTDWVASILTSCSADQYLSDNNGIVSCQSCPRVEVLEVSGNRYVHSSTPSYVPTSSAGGQVAVCGCPSDYSAVYMRRSGEIYVVAAEQNMESLKCLKNSSSSNSQEQEESAGCGTNQYLSEGNNNSCMPCPAHSFSSGGNTTTCYCEPGYTQHGSAESLWCEFEE